AEAAGFLGAPRGVVARVEVDHDCLLALVAPQRHRLAILVLQCEGRRRLALLDCHLSSFECDVPSRATGRSYDRDGWRESRGSCPAAAVSQSRARRMPRVSLVKFSCI